jgi:D-glycero-D-manno-heptose 1,7-bisphosphate phosphatase
MSAQRSAVFIDKDGTLVDDLPYNVDPHRMRLAAGAAEGLQRLARSGHALFVVSNQSGVALGRFGETDLLPVRSWLDAAFTMHGAVLAEFRYCPHAPDARGAPQCACRKPRPGMLLDLAQRWNLDLACSWMIGDILDDVEAGKRAGCRTILIDNGNETLWRDGRNRRPDFQVYNFAEAARIAATAATSPIDGGSRLCA